MFDIEMDWRDFGGLTFWGFLLSATTIGFGYALTEAKNRMVSIFEEPFTYLSIVKVMGLSLALATGTLAFGYVLDETKSKFKETLFEDVY